MLTTKQMQRMGLSRRQAVKLHRDGNATEEGVKKEISVNGKWRSKVVPSKYAVERMSRAAKV